MGLFGWVVVGSSTQASAASTSNPKAGPGKPINHADFKQFGFENFGNTCYANSILQALYFCQPFRDLICESYDSSNPPIPQSAISPPPPPVSNANNTPAAATAAAPPPPPPPPPSASRPPVLRPFRRRDSTLESKTNNEDPQGNGHAAPRGGGGSSTATAAAAASSASASSAAAAAAVAAAAPAATSAIPTAPPSLFSALRSLFLYIATNASDKGKISPTAFIEKVKAENPDYRSTMHQDAHEFLGFLLNKIVEDIEAEAKKAAAAAAVENGAQQQQQQDGGVSSSLGVATSTLTPPPPPLPLPPLLPPPSNASSSQRQQFSAAKTFVHGLFEGILTSETRCLSCETVSSRDESFLDLSIDIEQNSSVTACLRQFSASEMLSQKNKFFCDCCGSLQEAEKRMKIKKLPNVLALHLKRFKYQEDLQRYIKLSYRVAFPFELRLFNTVDDAPDPDRLYQLFAIVVHIGNGPNHGHYISIVRARGSWFVFDDDSVESIKESDICKYFGESQNGAGYVLFYQAVDLEGLDPANGASDEKSAAAAADAAAAVDVDVDSKLPSVSVDGSIINVNDSSSSSAAAAQHDGSSPEVAIVVQDEPRSFVTQERPIPAKLTIPISSSSARPRPPSETAMESPTPVASTAVGSMHEKSISTISAARSSASVINGFSETGTVSSDSSAGTQGLFAQTAETSSLATTQASLSPLKASASVSASGSTSPPAASNGNFLARKLKHSQSAKIIGGGGGGGGGGDKGKDKGKDKHKEKDKRRVASGGATANGTKAAAASNSEDVPPLPHSPSLSRSRSFRGEGGWFSSKRKNGKEKEKLLIPPTPTLATPVATAARIAEAIASPHLKADDAGGASSSSSSMVMLGDSAEKASAVAAAPVAPAASGSLPNGKPVSVTPASPSPNAERTTFGGGGKSKSKSARPSTAPSSATRSRFDEPPLPPLPSSPLPSQEAATPTVAVASSTSSSSQGPGFSSPSVVISSSLAFPSSPVLPTPSPSRRASQTLPPLPPVPPPVSLSPYMASSPLAERQSTAAGAAAQTHGSKMKRISRKSLTSISLAAMFGRKEKEKGSATGGGGAAAVGAGATAAAAAADKDDVAKSPIIPRRPSLMAGGTSY